MIYPRMKGSELVNFNVRGERAYRPKWPTFLLSFIAISCQPTSGSSADAGDCRDAGAALGGPGGRAEKNIVRALRAVTKSPIGVSERGPRADANARLILG